MATMFEVTTTRHNPGIDPALHVWGWEIPLYLFVGGMVAGMMILGGAAMLRTARGEDTRRFFSVQTPLLGYGNVGGRPVGLLPQFEKVEELLRPVPDLSLFPALAGQMEHAEQESGAGQRVHPDHDVLPDREVRKKLDLLIGAVDAQGGDLEGLQPDQGDPVEEHLSRSGGIHPGNDVEQARLPRPVGADNRHDLSGRDRKGQGIERLQPPEAEAEVPALQ